MDNQTKTKTKRAPRGALQAKILAALTNKKGGLNFAALVTEGAEMGSSRKSVEQCVARLVKKGLLRKDNGNYFKGSAKATPAKAATKTVTKTVTKKTAKAKATKTKKAATKAKAKAATKTVKAKGTTIVRGTPKANDVSLAKAINTFEQLPADRQANIRYLAGLIQNGNVRAS